MTRALKGIWSPKGIWSLIRESAAAWAEDKAPRLGGALAFYTIFSLSPLFVIVIAIARLWFQDNSAETELFAQLRSMVGNEGGTAIQSIVARPEQPSAGTWATIVAGVTLVFGATTVFAELQESLNTIWKVKAKPGRGFVSFIRKRVLSFAMILAIGFLLLVSLILSAGLAAFGKSFHSVQSNLDVLWQTLNLVISFGVVTLLIAMIFKFMPDVKIGWGDVWAGAAMTALLFTVGKFAIGFYLGRSTLASAYGAAGSVIIVLLWVYYSAQILFFGAEMTQVYARKHGSHVEPGEFAQPIAACEATPNHPDRTSRRGRAAMRR